MKTEIQIDVQDLDHLGIIAGIVDEIGIVEVIDKSNLYKGYQSCSVCHEYAGILLLLQNCTETPFYGVRRMTAWLRSQCQCFIKSFV